MGIGELLRRMLACREVADHPRALFRRATAHAALLNYEAARADFELCKSASPALAKDVDRCGCPACVVLRMHRMRGGVGLTCSVLAGQGAAGHGAAAQGG